MMRLWHWLITNWGPLGIGTIIGTVIGGALDIFKWKYPSGADWGRPKLEKRTKAFDSKVYNALLDPELAKATSHGMTGAGYPAIRVSEIAEYIKADRDAVQESLDRLEMRRRIKSDDGYWFVIPD